MRAILLSVLSVLCFTSITHGQWTTMNTTATADLRSVQYRPNGNVWIGSFDTLYWSINEGTSFVERPTMVLGNAPLNGLYLAVHAFDDNTALITGTMFLGAAESIYRTTNAGVTWSEVHHQSVGPIDVLRDLDFSQAPLGFAVGSNGRILRSTDSGLTWNAVPSGTNFSFSRIAWTTGNTYLAAGPSSFARSTDAGLTWTMGNGPAGASALDCIGNTCYAAVGQSMWKSADGGATWAVSGTAMGDVLKMIGPNTLLMANENGLYRSTSGGQYWEQFQLPNYQQVYAIDFKDPLSGIAVGVNGYGIRTGNAGGPALPIASMSIPTGPFCAGTSQIFNNTGDPSYTYEWRINGQSVSNAYDLSTNFPAAGTYTVELMADNGTGTDVVSTSVTVLDPPSVTPFTASASSDTICLNTSTTIGVPATQAGTFYRMLRDGVIQGGAQSGGGALTFSTGSVTAPALFTVLGIASNACGADTFVVTIPVTVPYVPAGTTWSFTESAGCSPYTPVVRIQNAGMAFAFRVNNQAYVVGNGGVLDIPMPPVSGNTTANATVQLKFNGSSCPSIPVQGAQSIPVYAVNGSFVISQDPGGSSQYGIVGQARTVVFSPVVALQYQWEFGDGAAPAGYIGQTPPAFQYTTSGMKTVRRTTTAPLASCFATDSAVIMMVDSATVQSFPICSEGFAGLDAYISDMCLDAYNNRYITGYRQVQGGSSGENAFFAMKLDSTGQMIWRYLGPSSGNWQSYGSYGYGIAADRAGNAYVTGRFDHENRTIAGVSIYHPNFLVKFNGQGELDWQLTSPSNKFRGITCTGDDVVHVVGYDSWAGTDLFLPSGERLTTSYPANDPQRGNMFLLDLLPSGEVLDQRMFGHGYNTGDPDQLTNIVIDSSPLDPEERYRCDPIMRKAPDGSLLIGGVMQTIPAQTAFDFGGVTMQSQVPTTADNNTRQVYALRYLPGQGISAAYAWAGGYPQSVQGISQSPNGQLVACGRFKDIFICNGDNEQAVQPTYSYTYSYILCADPNGQISWYGTSPTKSVKIHDVEFATDGSIYALTGYNSTGLLPTANGIYTGVGSGGSVIEQAVAHYSSSGIMLGFEPGTSGMGVAFNLRRDACGNMHVAALQGPGGTTENGWVTCFGCPNNLRTFVIAASGCAPDCFAASDVSLRDVAMEQISLSDSTSTDPGVRVSFRNMGQISAQQVVIGYRVNEGPVQNTTWNGSLAYANTWADLPIDTLSFLNAHVNRVEAWIDQVNGSPDDLRANDTMHLVNIRCFQPLHGTYSCGGDGADFRSANEAARVLAQCGINGPTTIAINSGHYFEQVHLSPIPGTSQADTVVFTSANGDSASVWLHFMPGASSQYNAVVVADDSCKYISFTDLSFSHQVPGPANHVILFGRYAVDINILRCHIVGSPRDDDQMCIWSGMGIDGFRVEGNRIEYGAWGINGQGNWTSPNYYAQNVTMVDNNLSDQFVNGIFGQAFLNITVVGNTITSQVQYNSNEYRAAYLLSIEHTSFRFDENYIRVATAEPPNTESGTYNLVTLDSRADSSDRGSVANNMIFNTLQSTPNVLPTLSFIGGYTDVVHNTIGGLTGMGLVNGAVIRNNIFWNVGSNVAVGCNLYGDDMVWDNNVFSAGPTGMLPGVLALNLNVLSLANWQGATGQDLNSVQVLPHFVSGNDLHLEAGSNFFSCPTLPFVPYDIDGDIRGVSNTRQGADEGDMSVALPTAQEVAVMKILPNPSRGGAMLELPQRWSGPCSLLVLDARGRSIFSATITPDRGQAKLDMELAPGCYQVLLINGQSEVAREPWVVMDR